MGNKTKKVKSTGRFGARYGRGVKNIVKKIEAKQNAKHTCPTCGAQKIKRKAAGIYYCTKCNAEFTGGAYVSTTMTGAIVKKMVSQKRFLPNLAELISTKEDSLEDTKDEPTKGTRKETKKEHKPKKAEASEKSEKKEKTETKSETNEKKHVTKKEDKETDN